MGDVQALIRDLRGFDGDRAIAKALRRRLGEPVPAVRRSIATQALLILPHRGALNVWVSATKIAAQIRLRGRTASVRLVGSRTSEDDRVSDVRAIDRGRVRAPSWGRRGAGQWHTQVVPAGFFSDPIRDAIPAWRAAAVAATEEALEALRRG